MTTLLAVLGAIALIGGVAWFVRSTKNDPTAGSYTDGDYSAGKHDVSDGGDGGGDGGD